MEGEIGNQSYSNLNGDSILIYHLGGSQNIDSVFEHVLDEDGIIDYKIIFVDYYITPEHTDIAIIVLDNNNEHISYGIQAGGNLPGGVTPGKARCRGFCSAPGKCFVRATGQDYDCTCSEQTCKLEKL